MCQSTAYITNSGIAQELYFESGFRLHTKLSRASSGLVLSAQRGSNRTRPHARHVRKEMRSKSYCILM